MSSPKMAEHACVVHALYRYSWIISSLVGAVYMFGFILMCPQVRLGIALQSLPCRELYLLIAGAS